VGIDARQGFVAIEGWTKETRVTAVELAKQFEDCGAAAINFTDIERDGMRSGPNIQETAKLASSINIPVVASGGVSSWTDIENLLPLEPLGVIGVITGRAIYDGSLDLRSAIARLKK
jgi:phosphoribosylformimino-5-aminoimidazole carboxamide ribotide isomerase